MSGQGYSFHGAKAKLLSAKLEAYRKANERRMWTPERIDELCEFVEAGPTDAIAFERAAIALGVSEDSCRRRFALLSAAQEADDWEGPTDGVDET